MDILSCGAGMQTTGLALMSCENKLNFNESKKLKFPHVPIYDAIIFVDLGMEPEWVYQQVEFIKKACETAGILFVVLQKSLYQDYMDNFGERRVVAIPFWCINSEGKKGKLRRNCTIDYKIKTIQAYVRHELLGYKKYQRLKEEDKGTHTMHLGFSSEESHRTFSSNHSMFEYKYPLIVMNWQRRHVYKYILENWGLDTKASACVMCPFHRNYFFDFLKHTYSNQYDAVLKLDNIIAEKQHQTPIKQKIFISRSCKRIEKLSIIDCNDKETFVCNGKEIWNGF